MIVGITKTQSDVQPMSIPSVSTGNPVTNETVPADIIAVIILKVFFSQSVMS